MSTPQHVVLPWGPASASGLGSLPGTDPLQACRWVLEQCPSLPYLPELPARGPGADLVGRSAALLTDLAVDIQPSGWRLVARPGIDQRRAQDLWSHDLDSLEEAAEGWTGPLKLAVAGPWTLAAALELTNGEKSLRDHGAVIDLAQSLADGVAALVADVHRRIPGAQLMVQLDEPSLPSVQAARVPTASGWGTLRAPDMAVIRDRLTTVVQATGVATGVHCCAPSPPVRLAQEAGAVFVAVDVALLAAKDLDAVGELVDAGGGVMLGLVPSTDPATAPRPDDLAETARLLWHRLGLDPTWLGERLVVAPSCGMAGASPSWPAVAHRLARETASELTEHPEPRTGRR